MSHQVGEFIFFLFGKLTVWSIVMVTTCCTFLNIIISIIVGMLLDIVFSKFEIFIQLDKIEQNHPCLIRVQL